jgi:glucose-1-phosphate thymidylyltransferase
VGGRGLVIACSGVTRQIIVCSPWTGTVSIGFGLVAFFLLPVFEYLSLAALGHSGDVGVHSLSTDGNPATWLLTLFVPYFFGPLQTYPYQGLRQAFFWDISPGYLGTSVFFLASVALFSLRDLKKSERRYDPRYVVFFITASFLILLKIFGVPPVNWIGYLPVLSHVIFPRYSGSVLAASFSGACAFGLQSISDRIAWPRSLRNALLLPLLTITFAVFPCIPILASPPVPIVPWLPFPLFLGSFAYLVVSLVFLLLAYVVAVSRTTHPTKALVILVILELVCYVPMSLPLGYEVVRVGICTAAAIPVVLYVRGSTRRVFSVMALPTPMPKGITREHVFAVVLVTALLLQSGITSVSPRGLPARYDAFSEAPYLSFLKKLLAKVEAKYGVKLPRKVVAVDFGSKGDLYVRFKHIMDRLNELAVAKILLTTNLKFEPAFRSWMAGKSLLDTELVVEQSRSEKDKLGAVRALAQLAPKLEPDDYMVICGDNVFNSSLRGMVGYYEQKRKPVVAVYLQRSLDEVKSASAVTLGEDNRIVNFEEKLKDPRTRLVGACIYILPFASLLRTRQYLDEGGSRDEPGNFISWLCRQEEVYGYMLDSYVWDTGTPQSYQELQKAFAGHRRGDL